MLIYLSFDSSVAKSGFFFILNYQQFNKVLGKPKKIIIKITNFSTFSIKFSLFYFEKSAKIKVDDPRSIIQQKTTRATLYDSTEPLKMVPDFLIRGLNQDECFAFLETFLIIGSDLSIVLVAIIWSY